MQRQVYSLRSSRSAASKPHALAELQPKTKQAAWQEDIQDTGFAAMEVVAAGLGRTLGAPRALFGDEVVPNAIHADLPSFASAAAIEGAAHNSHCGAPKSAVTTRVRTLALELARHRIRINAILPGWIVSDMTERPVAHPKFAEAVLPRIPARRWGGVYEFGGIAVYLASAASAHITGEPFVIDGGHTKF